MEVEALRTSWKRAIGAMFRSSLQNRILVFAYPHPIRHIFHTFFCPPLQIIALGDTGEPFFSTTPGANRFVRLPATRIVLETDPSVAPEAAAALVTTRIPNISDIVPLEGIGTTRGGFETMFFEALKDAVKDIRSLRDRLQRKDASPQEVIADLPLWQRGQLLDSAAYLIERGHEPGMRVPGNALRLAKQVCTLEQQNHPAELMAASIAGGPWPERLTDEAPICVKCNRRESSWRRILRSEESSAPEVVCWRYKRPENFVPLCRYCVRYLKNWKSDERRRVLFGFGIWGLRFEAFYRWHLAVTNDMLPGDWERSLYPLWPATFGGNDWAAGSGAWCHVDMHPPAEVEHHPLHLDLFQQALKPSASLKPLISMLLSSLERDGVASVTVA